MCDFNFLFCFWLKLIKNNLLFNLQTFRVKYFGMPHFPLKMIFSKEGFVSLSCRPLPFEAPCPSLLPPRPRWPLVDDTWSLRGVCRGQRDLGWGAREQDPRSRGKNGPPGAGPRQETAPPRAGGGHCSCRAGSPGAHWLRLP